MPLNQRAAVRSKLTTATTMLAGRTTDLMPGRPTMPFHTLAFASLIASIAEKHRFI
ncbi:hypothetical protein QCE63_18405 [Caballeronia sp. LZ065]|uniref:hypothetical protein n=1 Tax=Caballeronia sp. LZ065 TaxID=3038571 RepID=UPI0028586364|nr:hypothetical protein [Caballeronia sp. LZ065]MDR5781372.1 hypothetical protein [Caballeronia sp. LZ065]